MEQTLLKDTKYNGRYVALRNFNDPAVIADGSDPKEAYDKAVKNGCKVKVYGLMDTGADECAMPAQYATLMGHNLESGFRKEINTGNERTIAYSHTVNIHVGDYAIKDVLMDFMPNLHVPFLGVKSFLSSFIPTIDYPHKTFSLELKKND